jgi:prepilin-type N-terminal cleavage/methylation domain-containing protein
MKKAFTLVELLVAMAIFSILMVMIVQVIERTGTLSTGSIAKMEAARVARECLDLMGRDLSGSMLPYERTSTNSLQFLASPPDLDSDYANPHSLFWQAPLSRSSDRGNLALVGYFVQRSLAADPTQNRFQLRRLFVDQSDATNFDRLFGSGGTAWYRDLAPDFAPASESPENALDYKGWVADGVLGLWIRCLDSNGEPITLSGAGESLGSSFDSRKAYQGSRHRYPATGYSALPSLVEVGLVTCSPSDIKKITTLPSSSSSGDPDRFYEDMNTFVAEVQRENPGAKTVSAHTRIIPLLTADP